MAVEKVTKNRVIIIAGFLGGGKTTLLQKCLDWEMGRGGHPHVIMSEFGDFDVDGKLIRNNRIKLTTITGGCACCDLREELARAFKTALRISPGATIYIESTGVGDPAGIIESIRPLLNNVTAELAAIIVVFDVGRPLLESKDAGLVKRQLQTADYIVINKADLASPEEIQNTVEDISRINPSAGLFITSNGEVDFDHVLTGLSMVTEIPDATPTSKPYRSYGFQVKDPITVTALEKWLLELPPSVVRAKGFLRLTGKKGIFEIQATQGQVSINPFSGGKPPTMLVLIGHPMRTDGLVNGLTKCLAAIK